MDEVVVISTPYGDMTAVLFDDTPIHKENFLKLAKAGDYDSVLFHRIIENFMIQTGDLSTGKLKNDANHKLDPEFLPDVHFHKKGAIAAARGGDAQNPEKKSSGSQFYIVQGEIYDEAGLQTRAERRQYLKLDGLFQRIIKTDRAPELIEKYNYHLEKFRADSTYDFGTARFELVFNSKPTLEKFFGNLDDPGYTPEQKETYATIGGSPHLDGEYTVFGQVVDGLDVIDKIAAVETGRGDRPIEEIRMKVSVVEMSKKEISKKYGVEYHETDKP